MHVMRLQRVVAACAGQRQPSTAAQVEHHSPPATRCCCHGCAFAVALVAATWYAQDTSACTSQHMYKHSHADVQLAAQQRLSDWIPGCVVASDTEHDGTHMQAALLLPARLCCNGSKFKHVYQPP